MHIIIIANHQPTELAPLTEKASAAMLPVGGKPLIEHLLENVANVPHSRITVVASRGFNTLHTFVGTGERWGIELTLITSRPNEPLNSLRRRCADMFTEKTLVLSANRIYTTPLAEHDSVIELTNSVQDNDSKASTSQVLSPASTVSNHKEYLELNLAVARGEIAQVQLRGRERALGLNTGYMTQIDPRCVRVGQTHAGNHCRVHPSVQLEGTVVLNSGVVVDRNTHMTDVVVLDHTYVGEHLNLNRCIVSGRHIVRVDEAVVVELSDSFMTAPLKEGVYHAHFAGPANQLCGIVGSIAALPLMLFAMLAAYWQNPYEPLVQRTWVSNRAVVSGTGAKTFNNWEFNVSNRALARLPQLFAVALGHLRWFGVSPATIAELESRREPWQMARDACPAGMLGPAQLSCPDDATFEERLLSDAAYVPAAGWRTHLNILRDSIRKLLASGSLTTEAKVDG